MFGGVNRAKWKPVRNLRIHDKPQVMVKQFEELTDFQWEVIEHLFPEQEICDHSLRMVINAILWILRTGSQWRNMESKIPLGLRCITILESGKWIAASKK